jgi:hypothetical protein
MPILKTKMSKSAWVLIALLVIAIIALPILHLVGFINLSFIGDGFMAILAWGADSTLNGVLLIGGSFTLGVVVYYAVKKYIIGTQIPATIPYTPVGQTISPQPQQQEETVVSS